MLFCFFSQTTEDRIQFWFATGGAGFCISRPLALKMAPVIRNEKLITISDRIRFPDDVSIGFIIGKLNIHRCLNLRIFGHWNFSFENKQNQKQTNNAIYNFALIIEYLLRVPLTVVEEFHSHLEPLDQIHSRSFSKQVRKETIPFFF